MMKYFVELYSNKPINGNYHIMLTTPADDYMQAVNQYEEIIAGVKNPSVISCGDIPYNDGHYAPFFEISLCEQCYQHGSMGGNKIRLMGGLDKYLGEIPGNILDIIS